MCGAHYNDIYTVFVRPIDNLCKNWFEFKEKKPYTNCQEKLKQHCKRLTDPSKIYHTDKR